MVHAEVAVRAQPTLTVRCRLRRLRTTSAWAGRACANPSVPGCRALRSAGRWEVDLRRARRCEDVKVECSVLWRAVRCAAVERDGVLARFHTGWDSRRRVDFTIFISRDGTEAGSKTPSLVVKDLSHTGDDQPYRLADVLSQLCLGLGRCLVMRNCNPMRVNLR